VCFSKEFKKERDGFDLCAFAGTNAIFRLPALKAIGGFPYGTMTEDAYVSIKLHYLGYRSIYVEDRLAEGTPPETVGAAMTQRARWVKGSIQILMITLSFNGWFLPKTWKEEHPESEQNGLQQILYAQTTFHPERRFFRVIFWMDTVLYPLSSITAIFYIFIAFLYLLNGTPPVSFIHPPFDGYWALAVTFLPYLVLRFVTTLFSHDSLIWNDIWVAQQTWFGYAFASLFGIIDAFQRGITDTDLEVWKATGSSRNKSSLEWVNVIVLLALVICTTIRFVMVLFVESTDNTNQHIAAILLAGTIIIQLWPMVSMTLNILRSSSDSEKRLEIPTYILFGLLIFIMILFSEFGI